MSKGEVSFIFTAWLNKINASKANDVKALKKEGWKIINIREYDLKPPKQKKTFLLC